MSSVSHLSRTRCLDRVDLSAVLDTINAIESAEFSVMLGALTPGSDLPGQAEITAPIIKWLDGLDHAELVRRYADGKPPRRFPFRVRRWSVDLTAFPRTGPSPGPPRLIAAGPIYGGFVNDVSIIRQALIKKAGRYGTLDAPFVIAVVAPAPWRADEGAIQVLYGSEVMRVAIGEEPVRTEMARSPDGFWWPTERERVRSPIRKWPQ